MFFLPAPQPTSGILEEAVYVCCFYHDGEQEQLLHQAKTDLASQSGRGIYTAAYPYKEFYLAENRHQKYKLQRQPELMEQFSDRYPGFSDFVHSTAAARVNCFLYGYGNKEELKAKVGEMGLSSIGQEKLLSLGTP
ncbi:hypothetical protein DXT99_25065 [Pontibacter diazotrophicus]|uniref:peptide-methionine (S)-S-oxide reductase n=1 Tax=Pontibacter diazotrophicus TaxID=1400979 RepID=A0A3D8L1S2_9BACT|nr:hypothetical protein DXT99_25065 [Pontibacter diazotrophicus]